MAQQVQKINHVYYRSTSNQLVAIYYTREPGWAHSNQSEKYNVPPANGTPAAFVYDVNNSQNIIFRGQDGNMYSLYFIRADGWKCDNITELSRAPGPASDPSTYTYHVSNTQHVVYRSNDNHIQQLYSVEVGKWLSADMTAKLGAPPAAGRPSAYVYTMNNSQNIVYRGQDGQIYSMVYTKDAGWKNVNLTGIAGGPLAGGDPTCYTFQLFNTQHVIYRGQDNHIYQLYADQTAQWKVVNMTQKVGAPLAVGMQTSFADPYQDSQNLVYRGQDGHIHTIYYTREPGWKHMNLSASTGSPQAAGDPFGYTFDLFKTQHIVYRTGQGHLIQLYSGKIGDWLSSDLTADTNAPLAASDTACYSYDLK